MIAANAKDNAVVKMGFVKFKTVSSGSSSSIAALSVSDKIQVTIGGSKGTSSGTLTVYLPSSFVSTLEKGDKLDVTSYGNETGDSALISLLGTKVKIKGLSTTSTGISTGDDSTASGTLTVVKYDETTRELKFKLNAKLGNWTKTVSKGFAGSTSKVSKPTNVVANVVVTLP